MEKVLAFIEKLRSKPEFIRRQILFFTTVFLMGLVVLAWSASLGDNSGSEIVYQSDGSEEKSGPLASIGRVFSSAWSDIKSGAGLAGENVAGVLNVVDAEVLYERGEQ